MASSSPFSPTSAASMMPFSQVPGRPSFRGTAVNAVAMIPLLSTDKHGFEVDSYSAESFLQVMHNLQRYSQRDDKSSKNGDMDNVEISSHSMSETASSQSTGGLVEDLLLVVPNSQLTRPGDWRYDSTPLKNFHWGHGCQRLQLFDGRPHCNRMAHDRLLNSSVSRNWIDICPSRRTAAVVGILNIRDCKDGIASLHRAEQELHQWAERYSSPPYEVTFHGRSFRRDEVVKRLFVFDSFHDACPDIDLSKTRLGSNLVAFPPSDDEHYHYMELHLNVVVNDLAVAIFRQLESKIKESDALCKEKGGGPDARVKTHSLLNVHTKNQEQDAPKNASNNLSVANIANVVSPANKLAATSGTTNARPQKSNPIKSMVESASRAAVNVTKHRHSPTPQLLTPLDTIWDLSELNPRDAEAMKKRDVGRREKLAADLSLLAGSPMDAYERYSRAAELCKASPDPLWYAMSLEGCAAAHICMAECGGYNVDLYLESNFQMPDELMTMATNVTQESSRSSKQTNKQTLPAVVFALCEEALHVTNRHAKLAPLQAELLLKLAHYVMESDESHLRCRWGEGEGCFGGELTDPAAPPRWERTTVSQLKFPQNNKALKDFVACNTVTRCQKWTELLHRATSTGALLPLTRADVAATCARMCFKGMMPTQWNNIPLDRIQFKRKAAFFATVAADAISTCRDMESTLEATGLWLAACQFYGRSCGNADYGWATLRASALHALSQQDDKLSSEAAAEMLLALLCEMSPDEVISEKVDLRASLKALDMALQIDDPPISGSSRHSSDGVDDRSDAGSVSLSSRYSSYTTKASKSMSFRASFLAQQPTAAASLLTVAQAKWAEDDPVTQVDVPLTGIDVDQPVITLNCALPKIRAERCASAQKRCISHISELRQDMPTISSSCAESKDPHYAFSLSGDPEKGEPIVPPPLNIVSATVVPSESHLLLERCKAQAPKREGGSMATFFNPYDSKNQGDKKIQSTLVAQGEEREITIEFSNSLTVPLDVPSCQIEFDKGDTDRIKAPALSFVIPPKAKKFAVNFPFIVLKAPEQPDVEVDEAETDESSEFFYLTGLRVTCLSRSYFLPIGKRVESVDQQIPEPASVYQLRVQYDSKRKEEPVKTRVEALPAQPRLQLSLNNTGTDIADGITIPVHLADGEIFTMPTFHVCNDAGPTGLGKVERLQILGVGLLGLPDEILFDTDDLTDGGDDEDSNSGTSDWPSDMDKDGLPPLKVRALCSGLSLKTINETRSSDGNTVVFQIAAMHDMGNQVTNGGNVRLRFRYRGVSSDHAVEIWRKREVQLNIVRVKGPRISSLAFRPDLSWGSAYTELCMALAQQKAEYDNVKKDWKVTGDDEAVKVETDAESLEKANSSILARVGMDDGVHVSSFEVVVLMALANETNTPIILSNREGLVGGFEGSPMPTMKVSSGVSVKIPVVIPRIKRVHEDGDVTDIVDELVARTSLQWESESKDGTTRQGRIRIPSTCLCEIVADNQSFVSRICEPPVSIRANIGRKPSDQSLVVTPGMPVDAFVEIETADWVPPEVVDKCRVTLEFCAARKDGKPSSNSFVWCGLLRRTMRLSDAQKNHRARIVFLQEGAYVVSACTRLTNEDGNGAEETWWPPLAENVVVEASDVAAQ